MNTLIAFTLIFSQFVIVLAAIYLDRVAFVESLLIYGSPIYFVLNFINITPFFYLNQVSRMAILSFQIFKYVFLIRSFTHEDSRVFRAAIIIFEILYLVISYHYISHISGSL